MDNQCCFFNQCDIPQGSGNCKNITRDVCDGNFYVGDKNDPPCKGPNEMRCCVKYSDMLNGTASPTSSISSATATSSSSLSTSTGSSSSSNDDDDGMTGGQIGGTVVGVVAFVAVVVAAVFLWLWWKRRSQPVPPSEEFSPMSTKRDKDGFSELPEYGSAGVPMQEIGEGRERVEADAHGPELYEMEGNSPIAELDGGDVRKT